MGQSTTVLYVEDEDSDRYFMQLAFKRAGLSTRLVSAASGQEAIEYLAGVGRYARRDEYPLPFVVLTDLSMPSFSGFDVLKWIRQQPQFQTLLVVIFSSSGLAIDQNQAATLGANFYVQKPSSGLEFRLVAKEIKRRWLSDLADEPGSMASGQTNLSMIDLAQKG